MIESPLLQELLAEQTHKTILNFVRARFGPVPTEVVTALRAITTDDRLQELAVHAASCQDLAAFQAQLTETAQP
jgi:hypothetical protein